MAKDNGDGRSKRLQNALEEGWEYGHIYKRTVKRRKDGKEFLCTMKPTKQGFVDQDGKTWDAPTALTTHFMNKKVGVEGRRPAKAFFAADGKTPKAKKINTRPGEKKSKPAAKPKAAAKAAVKPAPAAKKPAAKAAPAKAPAAKATQAPPPEPPSLEI